VSARQTRVPQVIGWREWVALPDLGVARIKAKVDTGARTSALHAFDVEGFERDGRPWARFEVHPQQRSTHGSVLAEAPLVDRRAVRSSSGRAEHRWVVHTIVEIGGMRWPIELTLTRRDTMGFRMLLGRQAIRRRAIVDPGRSWLAGRPAIVPPPEVSL
jgi:hypothetical protein